MLAKRIIPCLDVHNGRVVKGVNFLNLRDAGDPVEQARVYDAEGADELVFLDITATHEGRNTMREVARAVADQLFIPFTVGGGIRTVEDVRAMLRAGADKVGINSAALQQPTIISESADQFGAQAIVVAIDARRLAPPLAERREPSWLAQRPDLQLSAESQWELYVHGGRIPTGIDVVAWAREVVKLGAGELLLTSMDADGTKAGYDLPLTATVANGVSVPVIASGGAGEAAHFAQALQEGGASAALAASLFHFRELSIDQVKQCLADHHIPVRRRSTVTL